VEEEPSQTIAKETSFTNAVLKGFYGLPVIKLNVVTCTQQPDETPSELCVLCVTEIDSTLARSF